MEALHLTPATLAAVVITISFAAGLNLYATVLALGAMARLHWIALPSGLEALTGPWIMGAAGILFAGEFVADKIPGFDLLWNAAHTFIRIPAGALLAYAATSHLSPGMQALATAAGAAFAGLAHGSKNVVRVAVTPSPEPVTNIALSSTEDLAAIGLSWLVMHYPTATGIGVAVTALGALVLLWCSVRLLRRLWIRLMSRLRQPPGFAGNASAARG
jgi:hypothetical protein